MTVAEILRRIPELRVLVVGDICLDRWCIYDPLLAEPSAETGIPRIAVIQTVTTPGAGGTVANNLAALGAGVVDVLGVVGEDGSASELRRALNEHGIRSDALISSSEMSTFTYTKLINVRTGREDLARVDFINVRPVPEAVERAVIALLEQRWAASDVVIVSDQAETGTGGVVTATVRERINQLALERPGPVVWVDSRRRAELFSGVVLKPNQDEAKDACMRKFGAVDFPRLAQECRTPLLIVTHGEKGALVIEKGEQRWVPGRKVNAIDICGAGDSFSAGAACAFRISGDGGTAAHFGNLVASITVTKEGTGTARPAELLAIADREPVTA